MPLLTAQMLSCWTKRTKPYPAHIIKVDVRVCCYIQNTLLISSVGCMKLLRRLYFSKHDKNFSVITVHTQISSYLHHDLKWYYSIFRNGFGQPYAFCLKDLSKGIWMTTIVLQIIDHRSSELWSICAGNIQINGSLSGHTCLTCNVASEHLTTQGWSLRESTAKRGSVRSFHPHSVQLNCHIKVFSWIVSWWFLD